MTATATGNPPRGQAAPPGRAPVRRRRIGLPRASTTPGKLRLIQAALVVLCLAWGALAALTVGQHSSAADDVSGRSEPISLDAQQMYQSLADADVTVSTAYLYGRIGPFADRERYQNDIAVAAADLKAVTAGSASSSISTSLSTLSAALPIYTGYVEDGEIYNSLGYPAGGSFIEVASEEMHLTLLPAARSVYTQENAELTKASAQATGLPLAVIALVAGLVTAFFLFRAQRWLSGRTHRTLNAGLFLGFVAVLAALIWLVVALASGRSDLLQATGHGSAPAETLAQADIEALQARGDETLNLISRSGDANFQQDFRTAQAGWIPCCRTPPRRATRRARTRSPRPGPRRPTGSRLTGRPRRSTPSSTTARRPAWRSGRAPARPGRISASSRRTWGPRSTPIRAYSPPTPRLGRARSPDWRRASSCWPW